MAKYKDIYGNITEVGNPDWNPDLIAGKTLVPENTPLTTSDKISSTILQPATTFTPPTKPEDKTNYAGLTANGQAMIDFLNKQTSVPPAEPTDWFTQFNPETMYKNLYEQGGLEAKSQDVIAKQSTVKQAQNELALLNAQMAGITAESQAVPIRLQQEATGRGITAGGLAPIQAGQLRDIALRSLPLQAQILGAQAKVQSAQGDVDTANQTLALAQDKINTLFKLQSDYASQRYNYDKELRDRYYQQASDKQKLVLQQLQKEDDRSFQIEQDNRNNAQILSLKAMENGQPNLVAEISALRADDPNFESKLAVIKAKIAPKAEKLDTSIVEVGGRKLLINNQTGATVKDFGASEARSEARIEEEPEIITENSPSEDKNRQTILSVLKGAKVGAGTKTKISDALNVMNAVEDLAKVRQTEGFKGISPLNTLLDIKIPFTDIGLVPFREALKSKAGVENAGYINAINLKVQQWASGAALTAQQTEQVNKFTPTVSDTDKKVRTKLNNLYNFMLTQVQGNLQSEGINFKPEKTNLFELYEQIQEATPEQLQELKDLGLIK